MAEKELSDYAADDLPPQVGEQQTTASHLTLTQVYNIGINLESLRKELQSSEGDPNIGQIIQILRKVESVLSDVYPDKEVTRLVEEEISKLKESESDNLPDDTIEELEIQITSWIHLFGRILDEETRIPASNLGIINVHKLSESPADLFDEQVWNWLDQRPRSDIEEACRSAAVNCSTASVMLSLRAVEHCLRQWYEKRNGEIDVTAWGAVLDQLMEEYTDDQKRNDTVLTQMSDFPPVLTSLYYLKEKRNEVSHPDESPSSREAWRTLIIVASTISDIYDEIGPNTLEVPTRSEVDDPLTSVIRWESDEEAEMTEDRLISLINTMDNGDGARRDHVIRVQRELDPSVSSKEVHNAIQDLLMKGKVYMPEDNLLRSI